MTDFAHIGTLIVLALVCLFCAGGFQFLGDAGRGAAKAMIYMSILCLVAMAIIGVNS